MGRPTGLFTPRLGVTDRVPMQAAIDETVAHLGGIDVLTNNAGFGLLGRSKARLLRIYGVRSTRTS